MSSVSVIIPCYNYARYLRGCVESVLGQTGVEVRVLILDDCSPDDTPAVAAELVCADGRVEFRRHAVNQRHIATYNEGLAWADGDCTLLLSADDLLTPGALARAARLLDARPDVGLVYGRQVLFGTEVARPPPPARRSGLSGRGRPGLRGRPVPRRRQPGQHADRRGADPTAGRSRRLSRRPAPHRRHGALAAPRPARIGGRPGGRAGVQAHARPEHAARLHRRRPARHRGAQGRLRCLLRLLRRRGSRPRGAAPDGPAGSAARLSGRRARRSTAATPPAAAPCSTSPWPRIRD